jgi:eukaryotic translation initiation factor 2C
LDSTGVSEGQFAQVLKSEVNAIRRARSSMDQEYKPKVTFLVVQKRHHTRFFPRSEDAGGRNKNVPPGTVVDREITHLIEVNFCLVSHFSIQNVGRPTKYHLFWNDDDDDDMTENEIEKITYNLCHMFSRCTRSVSYPAPTYYAHLAAKRARVYLEGENIKLSNLQNYQNIYVLFWMKLFQTIPCLLYKTSPGIWKSAVIIPRIVSSTVSSRYEETTSDDISCWK